MDKITITKKGDSLPRGFNKIKERVSERARKRREIRALVSLLLTFSVIACLIIYLSLVDREKQITFHKAQLQDVITVLEDEYQIKIETADPAVLACPFTGSFTNVHSTDEVIQAIGLALDLRYEIVDGTRYRLSGAACLKR